MTTPYTMSTDATTFVKAANKAAMRTALGTPMLLNTGLQNLAIGPTAGLASGTSSNVISIGDGSLGAATMTFLGDSVFIGTNSGHAVEDGNGNVAIGNLTLATIESCTHNVAIGDACCRLMTSGGGNTVIGYVAATERISGNANTIIGWYAGAYSQTGSNNVLVGAYAGAGVTSSTSIGSDNSGIGNYALMQCSGSHNIGMGFETLYNCTGTYNIAIGEGAGKSITSADATKNIFIGQIAGTSTGVQKVDAVNSIAIGYGTYTTASNQVVLGDTNITETILRGSVTGSQSIQFGSDNRVAGPSAHRIVNYFEIACGSAGFQIIDQSNTTPYLTILNGTGIVDCKVGLSVPASTTTRATVKIPHGTAPTSPVDGDVWTTSSGMFVRINGVTKSVNLT